MNRYTKKDNNNNNGNRPKSSLQKPRSSSSTTSSGTSSSTSIGSEKGSRSSESTQSNTHSKSNSISNDSNTVTRSHSNSSNSSSNRSNSKTNVATSPQQQKKTNNNNNNNKNKNSYNNNHRAITSSSSSSGGSRGNRHSSKVYPITEEDIEFHNNKHNSTSIRHHDRVYNYDSDSDCSSSIHSDSRMIQEIRQEKQRVSERERDSESNRDRERQTMSYRDKDNTNSQKRPLSAGSLIIRNREIREQIIQEVMDNVLPSLFSTKDGHHKQKGVSYRQSSDSYWIRWLQMIGCLTLDLHDAVLSGSLLEVQRTLKKLCEGKHATPDVIDEYDAKQGMTALSLAAKCNLFEICAELVDYHVEIECPDESTGRTPLYHAVVNQNSDLVYLFLKHGANPNVADMSCVTPLMIACSQGNFDIARLLCKAHADVDLQDERGWTALHYAVYANAIRCVKYLLIKEGANRDLKDMNGQKPIDFAEYHKYGECLSALGIKQASLV